MVLYLIGLGLGDENDITKRGLEVVKTCKRYAYAYAGVLSLSLSRLLVCDDAIRDRTLVAAAQC